VPHPNVAPFATLGWVFGRATRPLIVQDQAVGEVEAARQAAKV